MTGLGEGKQLSRDVSFNLNESAGRPSTGGHLDAHVFQTIDYKHKKGGDRIEHLFAKSGAIELRGSDAAGITHEDTGLSVGKAPEQPFSWCAFYTSYLAGFFFSVFAVVVLLVFSKREMYHRAGVYGATASMFLLNLLGLYYLTSIVRELDRSMSGPSQPDASPGLSAEVGVRSLREIVSSTFGRIV